MQTDYFLEFPDEASLQKASLVDFPSVVYIAAKSYAEFQRYKKKLRVVNQKLEAAYWPILEDSYWLSPFCSVQELEKLIKELEERSPKDPLKVLLDLELPRNKRLNFSISNFRQNKRKIEKLLSDAGSLNIEIATAESSLSVCGWLANKALRCLGLSYAGEHKRIIMYYSSMLSWWKRIIVKRGIKVHRDQHIEVGLGTIDIGISGTEPKLSPEKLEEDLQYMEENGIKTVVIFQLSGLNSAYLEVIKKHTRR